MALGARFKGRTEFSVGTGSEEPLDLGDSQGKWNYIADWEAAKREAIHKNVKKHLSRSSKSRNEGLLRCSAQVSQGQRRAFVHTIILNTYTFHRTVNPRGSLR
jgi:hypothetical protein